MDVYSVVLANVKDARLRLALLAGCEAESGCQSVPQKGGGPGRGPWQIEAGPGGSHYGQISEADANDPAKALAFILPYYQKAIANTPDSVWSDPKAGAFAVARKAECTNGENATCPVGPSYSASQIDGGWARLTKRITTGANESKPECTSFLGVSTLPDGSCIWPSPSGAGPSSPLDAFGSIGTAIDTLGDPHTWIRAALVVIGVGIVVMGAMMLANDGSGGKASKLAMVA